MKISLGRSAVPVSARELVLEVFDSGQFSPSGKVRRFEEKFAGLHGSEHGIFVNSGTDALRLGLLAMKEKYGWHDGDYVAVPAVTFVASVNAIIQAGLKPYFIDVGMHDYTMNPWALKWRIKTGVPPELRAVMPVHLFGQSCDPKVYEVAEGYGLKVIEDSCETILNPLRGEISCHSTYMAHHVTTGVGGIALTNDGVLNELMRSYANHGRSVGYLPGYRVDGGGIELRFRFERMGYSCRGTEFEAALGLSQLDGLEEDISKRRQVASLLIGALEGIDDLWMPVPIRRHTWMMFPIMVRESSKVGKWEFCNRLERDGIETREMMPITNQPCYKGIVDENDYSVAEGINARGFYIPCHSGMTVEDVERIRGCLTTG